MLDLAEYEQLPLKDSKTLYFIPAIGLIYIGEEAITALFIGRMGIKSVFIGEEPIETRSGGYLDIELQQERRMKHMEIILTLL